MKSRQLILMAVAALGCVSLPVAACRPFGSYQFVEDAAGGIWFTEGDNNAVSRLAPDGTVVSHVLPTSGAEPSSLAVDPQGKVWFAEMGGAKIGHVDQDGRIVEFPTAGGHPGQIAVDRRGDIWFTQRGVHAEGAASDEAGHHHGGTGIGHLDRTGQMRFHPIDEGWPTSLAFDRLDQAWVSILIPGRGNEAPIARLAKLSRDGRWRVEVIRKNSCLRNLLTDDKGRLYYTDGCRHSAGYRAAEGKWIEWALPEDANIQQSALGSDGMLWFTDRRHLGRIDRRGRVSYLDRPENGDQTMAILVTHKGDVVFSEFYNYNINRLKKSGEYVEHLVSIDQRHDSREVKDGEFCRIEFGARIAAKAEMDKARAEEVKNGRFKPDGAGTEKLVEQKCLVCHDARRLLLSRRSDWTPSITRMHSYRQVRGVEPLSAEETARLTRYFNENYGIR